METMTITRGLAELKLLDKRIMRKIFDSNFLIANKKSNKKLNGNMTKEEFVQNSKSSYESISDLIERRKKIKSAIVDSNAKTKVTIAGKEMTVAEAIERKDSIQYEKELLDRMEYQYKNTLAEVNRQNEKVQQNLDNLLNTSFGKEGKQKATENEIEIIAKPYLQQNEYEVIDPLNIYNKIEELKEDIEQFELEVDFTLSESNTITKIEI